MALNTGGFVRSVSLALGVYRSVSELNRASDQVMLEGDVREALIRLNPEIGEQPVRA